MEDGQQAIVRNANFPSILFHKHKSKCLCKIHISLRFVFGLVSLKLAVSPVLVDWGRANHFIFTFHWGQIGQMQINTSFKYTFVTRVPPLVMRREQRETALSPADHTPGASWGCRVTCRLPDKAAQDRGAHRAKLSAYLLFAQRRSTHQFLEKGFWEKNKSPVP